MARIIALALALLTAAPALALDIGPPIGRKAPALAVQDASGKPASLASVVGSKGVVLVFTRSAKWCPYCQNQLIALKDAEAELKRRGFRLAALSYDPPAVLSAFAKQRAIAYPLLSDEGSRTIDAFGLRDPAYGPGHYAHGVPKPAIFVLAPDGRVLAKLAEDGYRTRPTSEALLEAIDRVGS